MHISTLNIKFIKCQSIETRLEINIHILLCPPILDESTYIYNSKYTKRVSMKCGKVCSFLAWEICSIFTHCYQNETYTRSFIQTRTPYAYTTQYTTHFRDRLIFRHIWNAKWVRRRRKLKYGSGVVGSNVKPQFTDIQKQPNV